MNLRLGLTESTQNPLARKAKDIDRVHAETNKVLGFIGAKSNPVPGYAKAPGTIKWALLTRRRLEKILERELDEYEILYFAKLMEQVVEEAASRSGRSSKKEKLMIFADIWKFNEFPEFRTFGYDYIKFGEKLDALDQEYKAKVDKLWEEELNPKEE